MMILLLLGNSFVWLPDGWSHVDGFYYSTITYLTVGLGDFVWPMSTLTSLYGNVIQLTWMITSCVGVVSMVISSCRVFLDDVYYSLAYARRRHCGCWRKLDACLEPPSAEEEQKDPQHGEDRESRDAGHRGAAAAGLSVDVRMRRDVSSEAKGAAAPRAVGAPVTAIAVRISPAESDELIKRPGVEVITLGEAQVEVVGASAQGVAHAASPAAAPRAEHEEPLYRVVGPPVVPSRD